jgi:hypothetical protein
MWRELSGHPFEFDHRFPALALHDCGDGVGWPCFELVREANAITFFPWVFHCSPSIVNVLRVTVIDVIPAASVPGVTQPRAWPIASAISRIRSDPPVRPADRSGA